MTDDEIAKRVRIFDSDMAEDSDKFADHYTVIFDGELDAAMSMSDNPFHPQGVGMHVEIHPNYVKRMEDEGTEVKLADVPDGVRKCIEQELRMIDDPNSIYNKHSAG